MKNLQLLEGGEPETDSPIKIKIPTDTNRTPKKILSRQDLYEERTKNNKILKNLARTRLQL